VGGNVLSCFFTYRLFVCVSYDVTKKTLQNHSSVKFWNFFYKAHSLAPIFATAPANKFEHLLISCKGFDVSITPQNGRKYASSRDCFVTVFHLAVVISCFWLARKTTLQNYALRKCELYLEFGYNFMPITFARYFADSNFCYVLKYKDYVIVLER